MGYNTDFRGAFTITPTLTAAHREELVEFSTDRHDDDGSPGIWCDWGPNDNGTAVGWNGAEKTYNSPEWLQFLIRRFLAPKGYVLNGEVTWQGEEQGDIGKICIAKNVLTLQHGSISYR